MAWRGMAVFCGNARNDADEEAKARGDCLFGGLQL